MGRFSQFTRRDLIGKILPGTIPLIWLYALTPVEYTVDPLLAVAAMLIGGYVFGGFIGRAATKFFHRQNSAVSEFVDRIQNVNHPFERVFYQRCVEELDDLALPKDPHELRRTQAQTVYLLTRAEVLAEENSSLKQVITGRQHYTSSIFAIGTISWLTISACIPVAFTGDWIVAYGYLPKMALIHSNPLFFIGVAAICLAYSGYKAFYGLSSYPSRITTALMTDFVRKEPSEGS